MFCIDINVHAWREIKLCTVTLKIDTIRNYNVFTYLAKLMQYPKITRVLDKNKRCHSTSHN